jgi:hypothetical protein
MIGIQRKINFKEKIFGDKMSFNMVLQENINQTSPTVYQKRKKTRKLISKI